MIPPFNRRDSTLSACGLGVILAGLAASVASQWGVAGSSAVGIYALAGAGAAVMIAGVAAWRLPPDMTLCPLDAIARQAAIQPPPPDMARLRVAFGHEPLGWSRMDIYLDTTRIGQLRPGMALVVPVRPGLRVLSARVWLRRLDLRDQINPLPGTDSDITIRGSGSKLRSYGVERHDLGAMLRDKRTILVSPAVPEA